MFLPIEDQLKSGTYLIFDDACGTGGMLTVAEETLAAIGQRRGPQIAARLYGQEINPETYAICKADMLIKGEGENADNNVTYPSVIDVNDGRVKLAFAQVTPIQATPTTLVIDQEGRVAARIIGQLASASILSTLVADTLAEDTS